MHVYAYVYLYMCVLEWMSMYMYTYTCKMEAPSSLPSGEAILGSGWSCSELSLSVELLEVKQAGQFELFQAQG